jgi:hypothetical protein
VVVGEAIEQGQEKEGWRQRGYAAAAATPAESPASREVMSGLRIVASLSLIWMYLDTF